MFIKLSSSRPSPSLWFFSRLSNSKPPLLDHALKPKALFSKSPLSSICCSFSSTTVGFQCKNRFFYQKGCYPLLQRLDFKTQAGPGFDFGGVESVLEAAAVLTAIVVVHEGGHFLAAYLQGIHVSKFAVGFGPILAKFNANNVEYSIRAFPLDIIVFPEVIVV
ncbi:hypothetical protein SLEP1_g41653 [Rubroshorea leprosula]|uniref:Peptidase M50 domain-containing protein n=1 Tax=Rubroshorea leprosula TaxID=152421 RepID=A0AAV5L7A4_9ROSI|nr:hypothetical protein SLEP1_g41653 [Rubroshorea leprosula]